MSGDQDHPEFVEIDPTGRYGRYNEILGKGASKTVYRAFDEYEGIEVAWNQVKLQDFLQSPEELERLYCEIHLLKTLKHKNIMKFYTSWVDTSKRNINFVTEMFTSGTLRQYRQKHRRVNIRAVKNWCRQILNGLLYLHSCDPPVIHRDLKCDNIFINGNQGQVKIGDLGLAAILRKSHADHCVGTPEFMAPEVYKEQYNELVDIYSFGMCILEMVTFEYPYSECNHPAQIYKKVISGMKPASLYKVQDPEVRQFIEKCLVTVSQRLPARELLKDPFLQIESASPSSRDEVMYELGPVRKQPSLSTHTSNGYSTQDGYTGILLEEGWESNTLETAESGIELFDIHEDEPLPNVDITIKGKRKGDGSIHLKLRIADKEGRKRNIHFPFDIEVDTALSVATEMVAELDIMDFDVMSIAEMIDGKICALVPGWRPGPGFEDTVGFLTPAICHNCASAVSSYGSLSDILSGKNHGGGNLQGLHCTRVGCMHGRFAEVTYQAERFDQSPPDVPSLASRSQNSIDINSQVSTENQLALETEEIVSEFSCGKMYHPGHDVESSPKAMEQLCCDSMPLQFVEIPEIEDEHCTSNFAGDYVNEIQQELRWLKAKYEIELREYKNQCSEGAGNPDSLCMEPALTQSYTSDVKMLKALNLQSESFSNSLDNCTEPCFPETSNAADYKDESYGRGCHNMRSQGLRNPVVNDNVSECLFAAKNFCSSSLLPGCLPRTKSLPVDAFNS